MIMQFQQKIKPKYYNLLYKFFIKTLLKNDIKRVIINNLNL